EGPDPVARRDDHVVGAPLEVQPAVLLAHAVAGAPRGGRVGRRLAEIAAEERGDRRRIGDELTLVDPQPHAGQRTAHRARPGGLAERRPGQLAGPGLAVAVADL